MVALALLDNPAPQRLEIATILDVVYLDVQVVLVDRVGGSLSGFGPCITQVIPTDGAIGV